MFSYWEQNYLLNGFHYAIIGSGLVGLQTAIALKKANPKLEIAVLERGALPTGASTKNAGFACIGSVSELLDDSRFMTEDEVWQLVERRYRGLELLRQTLGNTHIGYEACGNYEAFAPADQALYEDCLKHLDWANAGMKQVLGKSAVFSLKDQDLSKQGLCGFTHLIHNRAEGAINTGRMMSKLIQKAQTLGIRIFNATAITAIEESGQGVTLYTLGSRRLMQVNKLIVATNGFAKQLFPDLALAPARNQVLITEPIEGLKLKGCFHYLKGYVYFRQIDDRILLGGGRHLDPITESTTNFGLSPLVQDFLEHFLENHLAPSAKIAQRWSGILGLDPQGSKKPILERRSERITLALRLGGMGVALGSLLGQEAAKLAED